MSGFPEKMSMLPLLFAIQVLAVVYAAQYAKKRGVLQRAGWIYTLLLVLVVWGGFSTWLGLTGFYLSPGFLASYPTFWLPVVPVLLVMLPYLLVAPARDAVNGMVDALPLNWMLGIHALRILALGTLVKAWQGTFSMSFACWVGIPDMLFGLSVLLMLWLAARGRLETWALVAWNILGVLVILPGAPVVGQMGLPGFLYSTVETPSMTTLYEFPMVLGPSLVVPFFIMINMFVAIRLVQRLYRTS